MAEYRLYCFAQSGNAYKVALMLQLCGADWEPRFVDYFNGETQTPAYRALNVMGEVPVLEHGDLRLVQSGVILEYLAQRFARFGPAGESDRREILRWILFDNHKLTSSTASLRFLRQFAKNPEEAVAGFHHERCCSAFGVLDTHLADRSFVLGDTPTIADLSLCGYLFWPEEFGIPLHDYPNIGAWLDRIRALPGWVHPYELMPGHPLPEKT